MSKVNEEQRDVLVDQAIDIAEELLVNQDQLDEVLAGYGVELDDDQLENLHSLIHSEITEFLIHSTEI